MEENMFQIRKDKIKNIAIVFLTVMLVLTFFSNSILNRALPEVATEYVTYDTITERVRGTGTVTAADPYKVVVKDSRTIESVAVSEGDVVMKDQVLFYLEDEESEELKKKEEEVKAKEEELSKQVLDYMTAILSVDVSNQAYFNIETDNIASMAVYQTQIEASRQKVQSAQDTVDSLNRQILVAGMASESDIDRETELAVAKANMSNASARMTEAQTQISSAEATITSLEEKEGDLSGAVALATLDLSNAADAYEAEYANVDAKLRETASDGSVLDDETINSYFETPVAPLEKGLPVTDKIASLQEEINKRDTTATVFEGFKTAYEDYLSKREKKIQADKDISDYNAAKATLASAKTALTNATSEFNSYQSTVNSLTNEGAASAGDTKELQNNLQLSLDDAKKKLADAQKEQEQLLKDISSELSLSSKNDDIADTEKELAELKEELAELETEAMDATIVAPVDGTIISVSKTAGESTTPAEEVALIQVSGKGMNCSFSVTNDQAAKVKVGDVAELQNAWYYEDVMVTLAKIKPDPDAPGKRKLLEFNVEGSVQNGESLTLSVGERSAEYDFVVPNSAIREDKNGKFILIIEEKATPFGNRYKARRVDAEVMASDETKSAVSADLQGYEYVITTSNQPVESGDQVRLAGY